MVKTYSIHEIASEFDRLFAGDESLVDTTEVDYGHGTEAGHIGHEHDEASVVGWFCAGGNAGHPVLSIHNDDLQRAGEALAALDAAESLGDIETVLDAASVRYERLV